MKRSDILNAIKRQGVTVKGYMEIPIPPDLAEEIVNSIQRAWEPEEEPLPERLEIIGRTAVYEGASPYFDANTQLANAILLPDNRAASERNARVLAEAVRRYNAWPELRRIAEQWDAYIRTANEFGIGADKPTSSVPQILAILDGKES